MYQQTLIEIEKLKMPICAVNMKSGRFSYYRETEVNWICTDRSGVHKLHNKKWTEFREDIVFWMIGKS